MERSRQQANPNLTTRSGVLECLCVWFLLAFHLSYAGGPSLAARRPVRKQLARLARKHAKKFFSLESTCLQGDDVEAIHDMRVASRKLHEALRLGAQMAGVKLPKGLIKRVREARYVLGSVRDMDVMVERLRTEAPRVSGTKAGLRQEVLKLLTDQRKKRLRKMRRQLAKLKLALFLTEFGPSLKANLWVVWDQRIAEQQGANDPEAEAVACFETALAERTAQWEQDARAAATSQQNADLHRARIGAKKVRYLLELGDGCGLGQFRTRIRQLRSVQEALGRWHDLMILEQHLLGLIADKQVLARRLAMCQHVLDLVAFLRKRRARLLRRFVRLADRARATEAATAESPGSAPAALDTIPLPGAAASAVPSGLERGPATTPTGQADRPGAADADATGPSPDASRA